MDQQQVSIQNTGTPRPTEERLMPAVPVRQGRPSFLDPAQIAGNAAYAILLYLGILYGMSFISGAASLSANARLTIALLGSFLLSGLVFGVIAVLRDRLATRPAGMAPEKVLRLDDTLRWVVPAELMTDYLGPMTLLRLNLLDLIAQADHAGQQVPVTTYVSWPAPLRQLATVVMTIYYGTEGTEVPVLSAQDIDDVRDYLAERHPEGETRAG